LSPASMAAFPIRKHLAASSLSLSIFPASLKILLPPVVFQSITKGMAFLPNSAPKQRAKNKERERERENKRPSLHGVGEFPMPKTWTGGRKRKMRGSAAHKGNGFRHRQGQKREGLETPGARSPIGKATEQNGELPLFCYCFWSLFVGPRRRILKVVAEKQLFKKKFLPSSQSQNVVLSDMKKEINPSSHHQMSQRMSCFLTLIITTTPLRRQIAPVWFFHNQSAYPIQEPALVEAHNSVLDVQIQSVKCPWCVVVVANFLFTARVWCVGRAGMGKCQRYIHHLFLLKTSLNCNW
jgi:hypothetical protein